MIEIAAKGQQTWQQHHQYGKRVDRRRPYNVTSGRLVISCMPEK
ncbi:hypothetical protein [Zooshikella ganghwensis]|nr:hypothetical protein [Zooshikella ganghwensis]